MSNEDIYQFFEELQQITPEEHQKESFKAQSPSNTIEEKTEVVVIPIDSGMGLGNFTSEQLHDFSLKAFRRFYFRPKYIIRQIIQSIKNNNFRLLRTGLSYI